MIGSAPETRHAERALAMTTHAERVLAMVRGFLELPGESDTVKLQRILGVAAAYRSRALANTFIQTGGLAVRSGPFQGMELSEAAAEGSSLPKLLGCYERELHLTIEKIIARGYGHVLNIGCAEGYYAVGLARRMPNTLVHAHDIVPACREACWAMAERNGVADRLRIGGEVAAEEFARFPAGDTVVLADIEGAELTLLDPEATPALAGLDILVELHNDFATDRYRAFLARFEPTHEIERIPHGWRDPSLFDELLMYDNMDQLLAGWEWRRGPNPWAWMTARG
jgi:hypothetical protein